MSLRAILTQMPLFAGLSDEQLDALAVFLRRRAYRKGTVVVSEGEAGSSMYFIEEGQIKLTILSPEGKEVVLQLLGPGGFFGELALLDGEPRSATAVVQSHAKLAALEREHLLQFLERHPRAAASLLAAMSRRLRRTTDTVHDAALLDGPTRLAKTLLQLNDAASRSGPDGAISAPRLTQEELAEMVGGTRESINRWLGILARENLVRRRRGRVEILNPEGLRRRLQ